MQDLQMQRKNISADIFNDEPKENAKIPNNGVFDVKNYLNVKLEKGENEKTIRIRLLTVDKDSDRPFKHIYMHSIPIPSEMAMKSRGEGKDFKSYVCLYKTQGKFSEELGTKCPFCEERRNAYNLFKKYDEEGNKKLAEEFKKRSLSLIPSEVCIIRCIERGKEDEGPKFWKFNLRSDKQDAENQMRSIYDNLKEEALERKVEPENIFDLDKGHDFKIKITRVFKKTGEPTDKTSVSISMCQTASPLTTDESLRNKWINDEKVWSDVFVAKPYDYTKIAMEGKVPWKDKATGKWVEKMANGHNNTNDGKTDEINQQITNAKNSVLSTAASNESNHDSTLDSYRIDDSDMAF